MIDKICDSDCTFKIAFIRCDSLTLAYDSAIRSSFSYHTFVPGIYKT